MRTFAYLVLVALVIAVGVSFATGVIGVAADHPEGKYIVTFTLNLDMICPNITTNSAHGATVEQENLLEFHGKVAAVRAEKNELVVAESLKNWNFELAKNAQILLNDNAGKLSDIQVGDEAAVSYTRAGQQKMIANVVRVTRK
jgi:hypothetical protein